MATSQAARSRRLAQKAARRKAVVAEKRKADTQAGSLAGRVAGAVAHPVERCLMTERLFNIGIGYVVLARRSPSGTISAVFFLVDTWQRGVKDVFFAELDRDDFDDRIDAMHQTQPLVECAPGRARLLLQSAVEFARGQRIAPHKDYRALEALFGDFQAEGDANEFVFGVKGNPFAVVDEDEDEK